MTIDSLMALEPGSQLSVLNDPFTFQTTIELSLEGDDLRYWYFDGPERHLAIAPENEEVILFTSIDEEFDPNEEGILFNGSEFEFNYRDEGKVVAVEGDDAEVDDRMTIIGYVSSDGERLRLVNNHTTGITTTYLGSVVVDEDILAI